MSESETVALLTPLIESEAIDLGNQYWRKQVLRHGDFAYKAQGVDRTLRFTPEYTKALAKAYREKVYDAVPFQFAGADNGHTNAIEATRGEIVGFEANADGLDAIFALEPEAEKVIRRHPKLPVSVRIIENLERADGKAWPAAIQHVLATWDPRITAMKPWEQVELSTADDAVRVIDLTDSTAVAPPGPDTEGATMPEIKDTLSPAEVASLRALLSKATPEEAPAPTPDADGWVMPSDEELERIANALLAEEAEVPSGPATPVVEQPTPAAEHPAEVAASSPSGGGNALDMARLDRLEKDNARLRAEADQRAYIELRRSLAEDSGIPPAITDLAKPLLVGTHSVDLSNGTSVDAGDIVRQVLTAIGEQVKLVDLTGPTVFDAGAAKSEAAKSAELADFAKSYVSDYGLTS